VSGKRGRATQQDRGDSMSALVCALSGEVPTEPVVSTKSGLLFEKKLITKYIEESGNCPVTSQPLTIEDLVDLQTNAGVKVRTTKTASLPGLLSAFQDEWGDTVKECYQLRKLLEQTRQELSHTLYQHDAACRVISKVVRERDEARQTLADASAAGKLYAGTGPAPAQAGGDSSSNMDVDAAASDDVGITDKIKEKMSKLASELSKSRKKRDAPATLASEDTVASYKEKSTHPVHLANAILCLDLHPTNANLAVSGGADNNVVIFDRKSGQAAQKMKGHGKKVVRVKFHPTKDMVMSASSDKTVKVWTPSTGKCAYTFKDHKSEVTGITVHATGDYMVSASLDKTWALYDLATGVCRKLVADAAITAGYSTAAFHPDGLILGTGTEDSLVRVWDVKTQQNVVTFQGHKGAVSSLNFSENGYYLVTAGPDGFKSWDLRKVAKQGAQAAPVKHLELINGEANEAIFDYSGQYLACAGNKGIVVYHTKTWAPVLTLNDCHSQSVTGVRFGVDAKFIATCSKDRALKFYSV